MKNIFTKNDIWRAVGFVMVVGGQFMDKEIYEIFGLSTKTNMVQFVGALLILYPFVEKGIALYKDKKIKREESQS